MKICPFCQAEIEDTARFCLHCMTPLEEKQVWKAPRRINTRWQGGLAALFSLAIVAGAVWLTWDKSPALPVAGDTGASAESEPADLPVRPESGATTPTKLPTGDPQTTGTDPMTTTATAAGTTTRQATTTTRKVGLWESLFGKKTTQKATAAQRPGTTGRSTTRTDKTTTTTKRAGLFESLFGKKAAKTTTTSRAAVITATKAPTATTATPSASPTTGRAAAVPTTAPTTAAKTTTTTEKPTTTTTTAKKTTTTGTTTTKTTTTTTTTTTAKTTTTTATTTTTTPTTRFLQEGEIIVMVDNANTVSTYLQVTDVSFVPGKTSTITLKNIDYIRMPDYNSWLEYSFSTDLGYTIGTTTLRVFPIRPQEEKTFSFVVPDGATSMKLTKCNVNLVAESYLDSYFDMVGW